jgi:hypothetical protein
MVRRRRPLRAVSLVFVGFVTLVLLAQVSVHFFSVAIPKDLQARNEAVLANIQQTSTGLALAASALGLVFVGAVLVITRGVLAGDLDIYRVMGLPSSSAFARLLRSHLVGPFAWVAGAAAVTAGIDLELGLDALLPIGLAVAFAFILTVWLAFLTSVSFSRQGLEGRPGGRAG